MFIRFPIRANGYRQSIIPVVIIINRAGIFTRRKASSRPPDTRPCGAKAAPGGEYGDPGIGAAGIGCPSMGASGGSWPGAGATKGDAGAAKGDTGAAGAAGATLGAGTVISMPQEHFACLPANESSIV